MPHNPPHYGWFARSFDARKASIRLRLLAPMAALRARGVDIAPWRAGEAGGYDAVIFSKSFTRQAIGAARAAEAAGKAVIVDICDNMFDQCDRGGKTDKRARVVEQLERAHLITVATEALGEQLAHHLPAIAARLRVVPDMLDELSDAPAPSLVDRWNLFRMRNFIARHPGALHCVWFGKSSGDAAGLVHVDAAVRVLARFAERHPVTLDDHQRRSRRLPPGGAWLADPASLYALVARQLRCRAAAAPGGGDPGRAQ